MLQALRCVRAHNRYFAPQILRGFATERFAHDPNSYLGQRALIRDKNHASDEKLRAWLGRQEPEPVLEPEMEIIDPHHHLWDWRNMRKTFPYRTKCYRLEDMVDDIVSSGHNIVGTVYCQCGTFQRPSGPEHMRPIGEVEYCQGVAAATESGMYKNAHGRIPRLCLGIIGTVDLSHPRCGEALAEMMRRSRNFRGVRVLNGAYDAAAFKRGFKLLAQDGLVFEHWRADINEIGHLAALAREFPKVTIVINNLGGVVGPNLSASDTAKWRAAISDIAQCQNVVCKIGGIQMVVNGWKFEARAAPIGSKELCALTLPWYEHAIRCFGPRRCMFESNFPPEKDSVSYRTLWNSFKRIASTLKLSDDDKRDMFFNTAVRVYRLREEDTYADPSKVVGARPASASASASSNL